MRGRRLAMAGGAVWYLLRYGLVTLLVLRLAPSDPLFHLNLIWLGGQSLVVVALYARSALGDTGDRYIPLMIIGAALAVTGDIATAISSSYLSVAERTAQGGSELVRLFFGMTYGVLVADLLILAALISYRTMRNQADSTANAGSDEPEKPRFQETRVESDS